MDLQRALRRFRRIGGPVLVGLGALLLAFPLGPGPDDADLDDEVLYYASSMFQGYAAILAVFLILMIFGVEHMHGREKGRREELLHNYKDNYTKIATVLKDIDDNMDKTFNKVQISDSIKSAGMPDKDYDTTYNDILEYQKQKKQDHLSLKFILSEGKASVIMSAAVIILSLAGFITDLDNMTILALFTMGVLYSLVYIILWLCAVIEILKLSSIIERG